jgi:prepilin-type N-terminal cleavage/methylation domain-containing protein
MLIIINGSVKNENKSIANNSTDYYKFDRCVNYRSGEGRTLFLSKRAITLTELLVAISIAGIIMMAAYAIFSSSIRQFTEGINQLEAQRNGRRVISFMRKKISSAVCGIKASDAGEKAPTGLSSGIELSVFDSDDAYKLNETDLIYKTLSETYYLSGGKIMFKSENNRQPVKVFDSVKSVYFKIFTIKRGRADVPAVLITVSTFCGNQSASYESMVTPVFISGLKSAESMVLPIVNTYAVESSN